MTDNLRDRIAAVLYHCDYDLRDWEKATDVGKQPYYDDADAVIAGLGLRMQYENGRVMYDYKPAACKANGHWQQRVVSDHEPYTE